MKILVYALLAAASVAGSASAAPSPTFRLPDGSAACTALGPSTVVCRSVGVASALEIGATRAPSVTKRAVAWTTATPVLAPGKRRRVGAVECKVEAASIVCVNASGSAIFVSRARIAVAL